MKRLFLKEYVKNIRTVGAVAPSSRYLARRMVKGINFDTAASIVELGAGTGVFTRELVRRKRPETSLVIIENNSEFCKELTRAYAHEPNVYVVEASAEDLSAIIRRCGVPKQIDYIVSGLPFASLPYIVSSTILKAVKQHTKKGMFITFQYTLFKRSFIARYFSHITTSWEPRNVPPVYILTATNKQA